MIVKPDKDIKNGTEEEQNLSLPDQGREKLAIALSAAMLIYFFMKVVFI